VKTIVIYDQLMENPISFFILDGDYTHLDRVYINSDKKEKKQAELTAIIYDENGKEKVAFLDKFPRLENTYKVIVAGFLP